MKKSFLLIPILIAIFLFGWWFALPSGKGGSTETTASDSTWTCSMHPQIHQPKSGICPICNMDLIPLTVGTTTGIRGISISAEASALLDIRISPVLALSENDTSQISVFGRITHDERLVSSITARIAGRIDKLFPDFTGSMVRADGALAQLYSPEIYLAQKELIAARNAPPSTVKNALYKSALRKLELLEISPQDIARIKTAETPTDHITIRSPRTGQVTRKNVVQGTYVKTGDPLFTIVDHSTVWLNLEVYERDLALIKKGLSVEFTIKALPGEIFHGKISYIDHAVDSMRRISKVRVDVPNPENRILPGMFATAKILAPVPNGENLVTIPQSAVLRTGQRAIVYVRTKSSEPEPTFEGREILLGSLLGHRYIVKSGLQIGELVVTKGAFKLDSELQLKAKPSMMNPTAGLEEKPAHSAPEELSGQWQPILRSLARMENGSLPEEIQTMQIAIRKVSTGSLQEKPKALWNEFSNHLLIQLERAKSQPPITAKSTIRHSIQNAARYLGLSSSAKIIPPANPEATAHLEKIIQLYLPLAAALANDDPVTTAQAAKKLAQSSHLESITQAAQIIADTTEIKAQRTTFHTLSNTLIAEIRANGLDHIGNAYVVHCPMADSSKGADWLSNTPKIINPYFGTNMQNCGSITETLSLEK